MEYRELKYQEINRKLFFCFIRRQEVTHCWRKMGGKWEIQEIPFIDDWSEEDYILLVEDLRQTIQNGGIVFGAFENQALKGFASVEGHLFGAGLAYLDLSHIYVSAEWRGRGIGQRLFDLSAAWARGQGARKLYISAHSAVESQAFYRAMGCVEAVEYNQAHVEKEPCDCQLECCL